MLLQEGNWCFIGLCAHLRLFRIFGMVLDVSAYVHNLLSRHQKANKLVVQISCVIQWKPGAFPEYNFSFLKWKSKIRWMPISFVLVQYDVGNQLPLGHVRHALWLEMPQTPQTWSKKKHAIENKQVQQDILQWLLNCIKHLWLHRWTLKWHSGWDSGTLILMSILSSLELLISAPACSEVM